MAMISILTFLLLAMSSLEAASEVEMKAFFEKAFPTRAEQSQFFRTHFPREMERKVGNPRLSASQRRAHLERVRTLAYEQYWGLKHSSDPFFQMCRNRDQLIEDLKEDPLKFTVAGQVAATVGTGASLSQMRSAVPGIEKQIKTVASGLRNALGTNLSSVIDSRLSMRASGANIAGDIHRTIIAPHMAGDMDDVARFAGKNGDEIAEALRRMPSGKIGGLFEEVLRTAAKKHSPEVLKKLLEIYFYQAAQYTVAETSKAAASKALGAAVTAGAKRIAKGAARAVPAVAVVAELATPKISHAAPSSVDSSDPSWLEKASCSQLSRMGVTARFFGRLRTAVRLEEKSDSYFGSSSSGAIE